MRKAPMDLKTFQQKAGDVALTLKSIANASRLMVLCKLVEQGERSVGDLAGDVGLSQSALSQHLARLREDGLITYRRERQTLWYRVADPRTEALLAALYQLYCQED